MNRPTHSGGVLCWVRNDIVAKRRKDLELNELEALWLEIRYKNKKFLVCTAYRPPGLSNFYDIFQSAIDKGQQSNMQDYIIIGDLNSDPNTHTGDKLNTFASLNRLKMHINQPTRITDRSSSILDQCLSNCPLIIRTSGIIPPLANNDHCTIYVNLFIYLFIYLGFYVAFNTIQVISRRVVGRAEETSTYSSLGLCTVNCRPTASNYQLSHLRPSRGSNPRPQRWEARVLPLCHRGPYNICKTYF